MLPIKKLYIDSRYKTADSVSDSNFELPQSIHMPHNPVFYVTDLCIPNVWRTVETGVNDKIYISIGYPSQLPALLALGVIDHWTDSVGTLAPGYYAASDFANVLKTALTQLNSGFNVVYNTNQQTLTISLTTNSLLAFRIYTDYEVQTYQGTSDPQSIHEIIQNIQQT
jgi:hypothetical protein